MFLEVNSAFEKLTGWQKEEILHKKASEFLKDQKNARLYWLSFYASVLNSGKTQEMTQWMKVLQRYLTISAIPLDKTNFVIILREAGEEAISSAQNEEGSRTLEALEPIFNSTHDAISLIEYSNGKYLYVRNNALHQSLSGFTDIEGIDVFELIGEETGEKLQKYFEQCINTGCPVSYEQEFNFASGKRIWQTEVAPVFSGGGIRYLLCFSKDISELKEVQKEKEQLTRRLQAIFNQHGAIKLIVDPISGYIVEANPAACQFYGYSREEFLRLSIGEINLLSPEHLEKNFQSELSGQNYFSAVPYRLKNGETRLLDIYSCPINDGESKLLYYIIFDATDRELYRRELMQERKLLKTTLESIGDGVVTTDNYGIVTSLNNVAQELTGWNNDSAVGKYFGEVFILKNEESGQIVESPIQKVLETGRIVGLANHTELVNLSGKHIPIADSAAPIKTEDGDTFGVVMVFRDVGEEKEYSRQIEFLSYRDPLTGLFNRRYIEKIMRYLDKEENLPISVIMGDVNGLKITNDVFGHKAGDTLLQNVAQLLQNNRQEDDLIARWGGDEFIILMPHTGLKRAEEVIQRIKDAHISINESDLHLSLSLGCATKNIMESSIQDVMREAEEYMYHQKLLDGKSYRNAIINTLLATLYEKSNETEEHSKRLEQYCHAMGRRLQLSSKEMDDLSLLALLHDMGKVGINPEILQKQGSLTSEEWDEMKRHPEIGYRIAQATPELSIVADFILAHHERWDGKGYPHGLKEEKIPLVCRIIAIADAFDAMTNDRIYRKAMERKEAIKELERNIATQFDPAITKLFIEIIRNEDERGKNIGSS